MISCLRYHGKQIGDISWNCAYEMQKRKEEGLTLSGFKTGSYYICDVGRPDSIFRVIDRPYMSARIEIDDEEMVVPRFVWKDGIETVLIRDDSGRERTVDSTKEVRS